MLRRALGAAFEGIEVDSSPGNPYGIPARAHAVLTVDLVDEPGHPTRAALDRVLEFLDQRLHARRPPAGQRSRSPSMTPSTRVMVGDVHAGGSRWTKARASVRAASLGSRLSASLAACSAGESAACCWLATADRDAWALGQMPGNRGSFGSGSSPAFAG